MLSPDDQECTVPKNPLTYDLIDLPLSQCDPGIMDNCSCFCHIIKQNLQTYVTLKVSLTSFGNRTINLLKNIFCQYNVLHVITTLLINHILFMPHHLHSMLQTIFHPKSLSWDQIWSPDFATLSLWSLAPQFDSPSIK